MSLGFPGLWDGMDRSHLEWDVLDMSETLGWDGQWDWNPPQWETWDMSVISLGRTLRQSGICSYSV